ncbi:threonylcarbamoyl-AMP synthase [Desulfosarcina sp. OttesenSCG-928-A07]|nr:threonylcarbamoyl-AMP synthase [Desulfosarcina sp. OttesenSCG-928-A07]
MNEKPENSKPTGNRHPVHPAAPDVNVIGAAASILKNGGVVVFPTSGLYGLGADALCESSVQKVFSLKRRSETQPLLLLLSDIRDMDRLVRKVPEEARLLMALWPGRLTLVFDASDAVPPLLTGGTGKIGLRLPAHPVAKALTAAFGGPITGTSANRSGEPPAYKSADLDTALCREVDLVLDAGDLSGGFGSTVVDVTVRPVRVIREGRLPVACIWDALKQPP